MCFDKLPRISCINPLPCHSDSVCTSLGLLLVYLDYLSALPCWILFADRRPTLVLGILSLSCLIHVCLLLTEHCLFVTTSLNKALHMDPHVSHLVRPVTHTLVVMSGYFNYCCLSIISNQSPHSPLTSDISKFFYPHNCRSLDIFSFSDLLCKP